MALNVSLSVGVNTQSSFTVVPGVDNITGTSTTFYAVYRGSTVVQSTTSVSVGNSSSPTLDEWPYVAYDTVYNYYLYGGNTSAKTTPSTYDYVRSIAPVTYPRPPQWNDTSGITFRQNVAGTVSLSGRVSYTTTWGFTGLPTGLSINSSGVISGTPSNSVTTSYTFYPQNVGINSVAVSQTAQSLAFTVTPTYQLTYNANGSTGGSVPTDSSYYDNGATVTLQSNPNSLSKSGYTFGGWSSTAGGSAVSSIAISGATTVYAVWNIIPPTYPPGSLSGSFGSGTAGTGYSASVTTTNMSYSGTWSYSGTLPPGLSLSGTAGSNTNTLSGTPTTAGTFSFTVIATNSYGSTSTGYSVTIASPPTPSPVWTDNVLGAFTIGTAYSDGVAANYMTGYSGTYSVVSGALPAGISLNSTTGAVTGTPTAVSTYSFTIQALNVNGSITQAFTGTVKGGVAVVTGSTWYKATVSVRSGSAWVAKPVYVYNGTSWVLSS